MNLQIIWRILLHAIWRVDAAVTTGLRKRVPIKCRSGHTESRGYLETAECENVQSAAVPAESVNRQWVSSIPDGRNL